MCDRGDRAPAGGNRPICNGRVRPWEKSGDHLQPTDGSVPDPPGGDASVTKPLRHARGAGG